jgi:hypothetical protein
VGGDVSVVRRREVLRQLLLRSDSFEGRVFAVDFAYFLEEMAVILREILAFWLLVVCAFVFLFFELEDAALFGLI